MTDSAEQPAVTTMRKVMGGYDQSEVNIFIGRLEREIEEKASELQEIREDFRRFSARRDTANRERPSFSELGGAFEDALHMAEDQSAKLVSDALTEATKIISDAKANALRLTDSAEVKRDSIVNGATGEAQRITLLSEQEVAKAGA